MPVNQYILYEAEQGPPLLPVATGCAFTEGFDLGFQDCVPYTLDWAQPSPSQVHRITYPIPEGYFAYHPFPIAEEVPFITTIYPDFISSRSAPEGLWVSDPARLLDPEATSEDKWHPSYPDFINDRPRPVDEGLFLPDYARLLDQEFTFPHWFRPWPEINFPLLQPTPEGLFLPDYARLLDPEDPTLNKWLPYYPDRVYGLEPLVQDYYVSDPTTPAPPDPTPEYLWRSTYPDVMYPVPPPEGLWVTDWARLLDSEFISLDKWYQPWPERVYGLPWPVPEGWVNFPYPELITQDKWSPYYPDSLPHPKWPEGIWVTDYARLLDPEDPMLKWWMPAEQPLFSEYRLPLDHSVYIIEFPAPAEEILLDKWWTQFTDLIRPAPFLEGLYLTDPDRLLDPEDPNLKWWVLTEQPLFRDYRLPIDTSAYWFDFTVEAITLDKWFQAYPNPTLPIPFLEGWYVTDYARLLDPEFPSPDKWRPVYPDLHLVQRWPVPEGLTLPDFTRLSSLTEWLPIYPSFIHARTPLVQEGLFVTDWRRLLDPEFTFVTWWLQTQEPIRTRTPLYYLGWYTGDDGLGPVIPVIIIGTPDFPPGNVSTIPAPPIGTGSASTNPIQGQSTTDRTQHAHGRFIP